MKSTPAQYEAKKLKKMFEQGRIIAPDAARDNAMAECIQEVNKLWDTRGGYLGIMLEGLARDLAAGDVEMTDEHVEGLVKTANALARAVHKRQCEEVEEIISATGGKRQKGHLYLCALLGVEPAADEKRSEPTLVQDATTA